MKLAATSSSFFVCAALVAACAQSGNVTDAGPDDVAQPDAALDATKPGKDAGADATPEANADVSVADATSDAADAAEEPDVVEAGYDAGTLDQGLVGLWNLDETTAGTAPNGTDFADDSGQGNHGVASSSGVTFGVTGLLGNAVGLSSGYVVTGSNAPMPQNAMTAAAWIKALSSQTSYPQIVTAGDSSGMSGYNLYLYNPQSKGIASFIVKEGSNGWGACWAQGTSDLRDGAWHHVVGVYTGSDITIWVDGVAEGTASCSSVAINYGSSPNGEIGAKANANEFNGSLDQVGVWSRALTSQEVAALYGSGKGKSLP